jgi:putative spermidine/putrescine transport system ATP-binding protein/spermidine/putrescine transport system ATP-binding protein
MVISDRIAVLDRGRVVQIGTAADLFERPRTRFVAQFIGRTNLVDGVVAEPGLVMRGGLSLRVAPGEARPGTKVAVSIRPHAITLVDAGPPPGVGENENRWVGTVRRASYLGAGVDYEVEIEASDVTLRVAAPSGRRVAPGTRVGLAVSVDACLPLPEA